MFHGFRGWLDIDAEGALPPRLEALGIVNYNYDCVLDEKFRLGQADWSWGTPLTPDEPDTTEPEEPEAETPIEPLEPEEPEEPEEPVVTPEPVAVPLTPAVTEDEGDDDLRTTFEELPDWQKYAIYGTVGLNGLCIISIITWCCA